MSGIVIDENRCKSCYLCIEACPNKLIKCADKIGKAGKNIVKFYDDEKKCTGCALCAISCPDIAIIEVNRC